MTTLETVSSDLTVLVVGLTAAGTLTLAIRASWRFVQKISHFIDDVSGEKARAGVPARPGIVEQVSELRIRQEQIGDVAQRAANDVAVVRQELTRNSGASTKDAAHQAARSAEAAAAAAELASQASTRTEGLLVRHMVNGLEIMAVGIHNDSRHIAALEEHGIEVTDLKEFPPVDLPVD